MTTIDIYILCDSPEKDREETIKFLTMNKLRVQVSVINVDMKVYKLIFMMLARQTIPGRKLLSKHNILSLCVIFRFLHTYLSIIDFYYHSSVLRSTELSYYRFIVIIGIKECNISLCELIYT